jgi:hypothetical protein
MKYYTLENIKRNFNNNLYNIFNPMLKINDYSNIKSYIVDNHREMRIDLICIDIYGNNNYIDELLYFNGIIDPYSIKSDDIIYYIDNIEIIRNSYNYDNDINKKDINLPTYVKGDYNSVIVDNQKHEIKINNKLK